MTARAARTLAATLVCAACWPGAGQALAATRPRPAQSAPAPSAAACYTFAVSALRRHVVVRRTPPVCAGLAAAQVNQIIGRAMHTVAGPLPKAAARRQDVSESRYLASLIRQGRPPPPESLTTRTVVPPASLGARLAALAAWFAAALAGGYLLAGRWPARSQRQIRRLGLAAGHAGLAIAGLCLWVGYMVTAEPALGWADVALTWLIVGLGMATLLGGMPGSPTGTMPEPAAATAGSAAFAAAHPARAPVLIIALHGALATATLVLVLLAVVSTG